MTRRALLLSLCVLITMPACGALKRWRGAEHSDAIDLNTASRSKIESLPGITPNMAKQIVAGRPYKSLHELIERDILTRRELDRIEDRVTLSLPAK